MKLLLVLAAALFSPSAWSGCSYIAEYFSNDLQLEISDGGCGQLSISFSREFTYREDGRSVKPGSWMSYPFDEECTFGSTNDDQTSIISCHKKGRTPLAGATYKFKRTGTRYREYDECGEKLIKPIKEEVWQYVCVSGCEKNGVPKKLDQMKTCD